MKKLITTLCIIHDHPRILLGMKKRRFGAGRWNGFGGKVMEGESIEDSLLRELKEEVGLEPVKMEKQGVIDFELQDGSGTIEVNIFRITEFKGDPIDTEEMSPKWFHIDEIPFPQMWPTDVYWMPLLLKGRKFKGKIALDKPSDAEYTSRVLSKELMEVENL